MPRNIAPLNYLGYVVPQTIKPVHSYRLSSHENMPILVSRRRPTKTSYIYKTAQSRKMKPNLTHRDSNIYVPELAIFSFDEELMLQESRSKHAAPVFPMGRPRELSS